MKEKLNHQASQMIQDRLSTLSETIVARQYELEPEVWEPYGEVGRQKALQDSDYHLSYLIEAIKAGDPSLFAEYVAWVKSLFDGLGFPQDALRTALACTQEALQETLPPEMMSVVQEHLDAGVARLSAASTGPPAFISESAPLGDLAQRYLEALLQGDRHAASRLVLEAVDNGVSVKEIYLNVFQPTQYEVGRLWQTNRVSVAQEHYCTAATQLIMSQLYTHIFTTERVGHRLVATCVGGELHEIGIRMVADFFEMEGWDTYYLGANTPTRSIAQAVTERQANVLAISATMTFHVSAVAELIEHVRSATHSQPVKVLVGGYPFNIASELWQRLGADGYAQDAQEAVAAANRLVIGETLE